MDSIFLFVIWAFQWVLKDTALLIIRIATLMWMLMKVAFCALIRTAPKKKKKKKLWKLCFSRSVKHSRIVSKIKQVFSKHKYHVELERFVDMTILKKFIFWVPIACKETKHCAKIVVDVQMFKILFLPQQKVRSRAFDYSHPFNRMINMTKTMSKVQLQRFPSPSSQGMLDNKV